MSGDSGGSIERKLQGRIELVVLDAPQIRQVHKVLDRLYMGVKN